jgi:hypothetical protein
MRVLQTSVSCRNGGGSIFYTENLCVGKRLLNIEIYVGTANGEVGNLGPLTSQIDALLLNFRFVSISVYWLHVVHCHIRSRK